MVSYFFFILGINLGVELSYTACKLHRIDKIGLMLNHMVDD